MDKQAYARLAQLESQVDLLESEISNLNELLCLCGFPQGIVSLKEAACEIIEEQNLSLIDKRSL